jgi:hypothetical protein
MGCARRTSLQLKVFQWTMDRVRSWLASCPVKVDAVTGPSPAFFPRSLFPRWRPTLSHRLDRLARQANHTRDWLSQALCGGP